MKKLLNLFFEDDSEKKGRGPNKYIWFFAVWALILLANSIFERFQGKDLIGSSFAILTAGLVILFVSEIFEKNCKRGS